MWECRARNFTADRHGLILKWPITCLLIKTEWDWVPQTFHIVWHCIKRNCPMPYLMLVTVRLKLFYFNYCCTICTTEVSHSLPVMSPSVALKAHYLYLSLGTMPDDVSHNRHIVGIWDWMKGHRHGYLLAAEGDWVPITHNLHIAEQTKIWYILSVAGQCCTEVPCTSVVVGHCQDKRPSSYT